MVSRLAFERQAGAWPAGQAEPSKLDAHEAFILALVDTEERDITPAEIAEHLEAERGIKASLRRSTRSSQSAASRKKKTAHAAEQQRPDVLAAREQWFDGQLDLDPSRLIFVDESGHQDGAASRSRAARRALPGSRASRPLEVHDLHGRLAP